MFVYRFCLFNEKYQRKKTYILQIENKIKNSKNLNYCSLDTSNFFFSDEAIESMENRAHSVRYNVAVNERKVFEIHLTEREW